MYKLGRLLGRNLLVIGFAFAGLLGAVMLVRGRGSGDILKEGPILQVVLKEPNGAFSLMSRKAMPKSDIGIGGSYGEDMYGVLHPSYLEIRERHESGIVTTLFIKREDMQSIEFCDASVPVGRYIAQN